MIRFTFLTLLLICSCGKSKSGDAPGNPQAPNRDATQSRPTPGPLPTPHENKFGSYRALLSTDETIVGTVKLLYTSEQFAISLHVASPKRIYRQYIHSGEGCPTSIQTKAKVLIPLDGDLSSQALGEGKYPRGLRYNYRNEVKSQMLLNDLRLPDEDLRDEVVKLKSEDPFDLEAYYVVLTAMLDNEEVPLACGKLVNILEESASE